IIISHHQLAVKVNFDINKKEIFIRGGRMTSLAEIIDGKKFMWDQGDYFSEEEARKKIAEYEKEGFETRLVKEEAKYLVYTRRVVTEIILDEGGQLL
ncbi:hypothetical protein ACFLT2_14705, partial [Acidobacteriota bacterium]